MATGSLYGNSSESIGLYGNTTSFGGSYFEWFIFIQSETQPATPTGGSWSFTTNSGTPPTGWSVVPPSAPTLPIWVSIALVNSKNSATLTWSAPGLFAYSSGLPILSGSGEPNPGDGLTSQLYIQTGTTPETIWFKQAGTWTRLTGSTLYADLTSNQTIAGTKTFSSPIAGSVTGTSANVTGIVGITNGGTGSTTAAGARTALGVTATGQDTTYAYRANNLSDLASASSARTNLGLGSSAVLNAGVANGVATLDSGGTVPLSQIPASIQGGVSYQGTWNASTNTPTLTSSVGTKGYYYVVSVAGSTNLNGITDWQIGDWAIYSGTAWQKIDNTDAVTSVNGYTGTVVLNAADVGALSNVTSTDGSVTITSPTSTTRDLSVATAASTTNVLCQVRNTTGATLTKGTVVYISGATGQLPTVSKAIATGDSTSAQTLGMMTADLANNSNGYVTVIGLITNIDTSAYTDGAQLYLSGTTAGAVTATKPSAPIHLVYIAVVEYAHPTQGKLFVKVQNGYELDEIHDVSIVSPTTGQTLVYSASTDLWSNSNAPVISGTTINNTTIGATTASSGAFTTLSASSSVTLSGGTANGVTYLNGSKQLVSGSALTFNGTNLTIGSGGKLLYSGVSYGVGIDPDGSGGFGAGYNFETNAGSPRYLVTGPVSGQYISSGSAPFVAWYLGSSAASGTAAPEQMRLTSTGLGIGTSSPGDKLQVGSGNSSVKIGANGANNFQIYNGALTQDGTNYAFAQNYTGQNTQVNAATGGQILLQIASNTKATLDSSGNLGLGVTPSAWSSTFKALEVGYVGNNLVGFGGSDVAVTSGCYYAGGGSSGWKYSGTNSLGAGFFEAYNGTFLWYQKAPIAHTAGDGISFSQVMTLDASGRLLVGVTSANGSTLQIHGSSGSTNTVASVGAGALTISSSNPGSATGIGGRIFFGNGDDYYSLTGSISGIYTSYSAGAAGGLVFSTSSGGGAGGITERARIDSSGNLLIDGDATPSAGAGAYVALRGGDNTCIQTRRAGTANREQISFFNGNGQIGSISTSGTTTSYNTTSDQRLKENIVDAPEFGSVIDSIKVRSYDWKADGNHQRAGFVAQELVTVAPEAVHQPVDTEQMMAVDYSKLVPMLVKEIQSLRQRVAQLETN